MTEPRPHADAKYEEYVRELFDLSLTPEEFVARRSHEFHQFSFAEHRYSDPELDDWIQRLARIFFSPDLGRVIAELREEYLTPEERDVVEAKDREPL